MSQSSQLITISRILPNGHLILIADTQRVISGTTVTGDVIIDLDTNHKPVWLWNEFDHLSTSRQPMGYPDWTHTNAVLYSADDGNLIVSIRHQNWLVKFNYNNGAGDGTILWHLGYQGDFTLINGSDPVDWFYAQHGPSFVTTNTTGKFTLAIFDNGNDRFSATGLACGGSGQPPCTYSTVPVLQLDETAKTATLAFHPTTPTYSIFGGNSEVLKNGNLEYDNCAPTYPAQLMRRSSKSRRRRRRKRCGRCRLPGNMRTVGCAFRASTPASSGEPCRARHFDCREKSLFGTQKSLLRPIRTT